MWGSPSDSTSLPSTEVPVVLGPSLCTPEDMGAPKSPSPPSPPPHNQWLLESPEGPSESISRIQVGPGCVARSTSAPISCASSVTVVPPSCSAEAASAQPHPPWSPREGCRTWKTSPQPPCKLRPHSLVDSPACTDTRVLVAKLLKHSHGALAEVCHVACAVHTGDAPEERHCDETFLGTSILDQDDQLLEDAKTLGKCGFTSQTRDPQAPATMGLAFQPEDTFEVLHIEPFSSLSELLDMIKPQDSGSSTSEQAAQ
ncbi:PREDICTED: protein FAM189A1-like [Elephantulus edwardii]|uniref:protein FAM189A1-like n=1 Tax=Elephantulus edwardii TaxID=28737 RepID=UPI0003F0A0FB|nr:PREDICTED: protein FAM189A1-like [Elephantulus edwardii]